MASSQRTCHDCGEPVPDIVSVMEHGQSCDAVLRPQDLTGNEQSTLLYVESRLVDHGGELALVQMNYEDQQNIKLFQAADLLTVEGDQVLRFTDAAWDLVRDCRQMRAARSVEFDVGDVPGESNE